MAKLPLAHLTVLDLTLHRAGPTCARQLADWGAKVIKIEMPGGAEGRGHRRQPSSAPTYQNLHRNKRAMTINLKSEEGRAIFLDLAKQRRRGDRELPLRREASARASTTRRSRKINPRIVYGSISGFGQDGPDATRPGVDQIAQGMGGLMSITGEPGRGPMRVGIPIADLTAGLFLFQACAARADAARANRRGAMGAHLAAGGRDLHARFPGRALAAVRAMSPSRPATITRPRFRPACFPPRDGYINIAASGDQLWARFCETSGRSRYVVRSGLRERANCARAIARR